MIKEIKDWLDKYDIYEIYNVSASKTIGEAQTQELSEALQKEYYLIKKAGLEEKIAKALWRARVDREDLSILAKSWEETCQNTKDFYYDNAKTIIKMMEKDNG